MEAKQIFRAVLLIPNKYKNNNKHQKTKIIFTQKLNVLKV